MSSIDRNNSCNNTGIENPRLHQYNCVGPWILIAYFLLSPIEPATSILLGQSHLTRAAFEPQSLSALETSHEDLCAETRTLSSRHLRRSTAFCSH